jgi:hypothetical protein
MILDAVSRRLKTGEFTAEQIVAKVHADSSAMAIVDHLLDGASEIEVERLLLDVLPNKYFELLFETSPEDLAAFEKVFRLALRKAPWSTRQKVNRRLLEIIKTENQAKVFAYETAFFRSEDLVEMDPVDRSIVLKHLLWRLADEMPSRALLNAIDGIESFLDEKEFENLCTALILAIEYSPVKGRFAPHLHVHRMLKKDKVFVGSKSVAELTAAFIRKHTANTYDQSLAPRELLNKLYSEAKPDDIPF